MQRPEGEILACFLSRLNPPPCQLPPCAGQLTMLAAPATQADNAGEEEVFLRILTVMVTFKPM